MGGGSKKKKQGKKKRALTENTGGATAAELETLGELVRRRVREDSGHDLQWEVMRVGEPLPET